MKTAYLVGVINTDTGEFLGCSIFGEDTPTLGGNRWCFTIQEARATDFDEAVKAVECGMLPWARKFYRKR